ncbi:MAG: hypothetical protein PHZ09_10190 [Eubacteriales bacterium]|nr:hypothetical protein [Eubacteriales bacterium]
MIKIIYLFLTVLLLIPVIISCSDSGIAVDDESAITETETAEQMTEKPMLDLPQEDYEGYDFNFLHWTIAGWSYIEGDLAAEQESGETLNDAVYRRNSVIEDRYNIEINAFYESQDKIVNNIKNLVLSEDNTYSAFFPRGFELSTGLFASNSFFDLNTLPYIDFTMPWWDTNLAEGLSVNGRLYAMLSDITIIDKRATGAVLFNKSIAKDYNLPDLYEIINENNWTTEKLLSLISGVATDLDGDSQLTDKDLYGFVGQDSMTVAMYLGLGGNFAQKDENDLPYPTFGGKRTFEIFDKINKLVYDSGEYMHVDWYRVPNAVEAVHLAFSEERALFCWNLLQCLDMLRSEETDFGVLPVPKFDENQEDYKHMVSIHVTGFLTVPLCADNPDRTGLVLEALAAESRNTLIPAYYDVMLTQKYVRDDNSAEMLDIVFSSRVYDIGDIFGFGGLGDTILRIISSNKDMPADLASLIAKKENAITKDIDKFITQMTAG